MKSTTALLALAAVADASPLASRISKRHDVMDSKETYCKGWDLRTAEGVDKLWDESDAGVDLELFINSHPASQTDHQKNWMQNIEKVISGGGDGRSGSSGCGIIGSTCNPMGGISCQDQFDKYGKTFIGKSSYWSFQAVKGMHSKFNELHRMLTTETIVSGLKIDQMIKDFEGSESEPGNVKGWFAAAATMGNALGGLIPGGSAASAGLGLVGGLMSGLALEDKKDNGAATISASLADMFKAASVKLEDTVRIATGGGKNDDEYNSLPAPKWDTYQTKIAKFFNGGWFLLDDDVETVRVTLGSITNNIQKKVANDVMKAGKLHLVADKFSGASESREKCGFKTGRQWLPLRDGEEYCFYIMRHDQHGNGGWAEVGDDIYKKMADFGLGDREPYYKALIDCALNKGDNDDVDTSNLVQGEIPRCFFNMPAVFVEPKGGKACGSPFDSHNCVSAKKSSPLKD
ncbi:hypothetical protein F53441_3435 [Fusarium austroafricanum]|uniref:Uncharacterized protein n=1 Tax=Fusarium austroafricanum TaxID=2364996 RepID=A0A8H4KMD0_9HYPO|nr:hypothetical protein F53441_3435 [Fusarium austroafricanum]